MHGFIINYLQVNVLYEKRFKEDNKRLPEEMRHVVNMFKTLLKGDVSEPSFEVLTPVKPKRKERVETASGSVPREEVEDVLVIDDERESGIVDEPQPGVYVKRRDSSGVHVQKMDV